MGALCYFCLGAECLDDCKLSSGLYFSLIIQEVYAIAIGCSIIHLHAFVKTDNLHVDISNIN